MRKRMPFISLLLFLFLKPSFSQEIYEVGTGQASLEPDGKFVSLALAGYASPWDGRFTIQWSEKGEIPSFISITGGKNGLYSVDGQSLFRSSPTNPLRWEKIGDAVDIRYISIEENIIIGITSDGHLKKGDLSKKRLKWKEIGTTGPARPVNAITIAADRLYLADGEGLFWIADISSGKVKWERAGIPLLKEVASLIDVDEKLVALTTKGVLFQQGSTCQHNKWIKIGYKNEITVVEDMAKIAVANHHIYGIDGNNRLYIAEHSSKGDLSARALAIRSGDNIAVIVGLDLTGINDKFAAIVKEELNRKRGLPISAIFINSSHTHFAPVTQNWPTWQESNRLPDSTYLYTTVKEAIINAVCQSLDNVKSAELFFGRGKAQLGYNRSLPDRPDLYDDAVDVIRFRYLHDHSEGYLFMAACHPVLGTIGKLNFTISANFPGVARKLIEEKRGTSCTIFLQGTAGDINPLDDSADVTGEKLANEVIAVLNRPMQQIRGEITTFLDTIEVDIDMKSREELLVFIRDEKNNTNGMLAERNQIWGEIMLSHLQNGMKQFSMPVYVHTLNIGNWKLVGFSRETTSPYSFRLKELWPGKMVSVAGYTNDVSSYLPTRLHIDKRNYEGMDSFYWYGMPDTYPLDIEERVISQIQKNNR